MFGEIEEVKKEKFWSSFYKKTAGQKIPFEASFELTYRCNLRCRHCYIVPDPHKQELNTNEVIFILDQLAEAGCLQLYLTGGEIFTREDIFKILKVARNKGFNITLSTNGTLINSEAADRIKELGLIWLEISLYGITKETYQAVTQIPGSFKQCLKGIGLLKKRDIPLWLKMTVMRQNVEEFDQIKAFADELGVGFRYGGHIHSRIDGSRIPLSFCLSPEECINLEMKNLNPFEEEKRPKKTPTTKRRFFYCNAGRNSLAITAYGEMNLCISYRLPQYNLREESLYSSWKKLVNFVKLTQPGQNYKCHDCDLFEFCSWCPADGWLEERDLSACIPYFRRLAELRRERITSLIKER